MAEWQIWIDTGGTFTDCIARDPDGRIHRVKVLSSSALRGKILSQISPTKLRIEQNWDAPSNFIKGFSIHFLGKNHDAVRVEAFDATASTLTLSSGISLPKEIQDVNFEVVSTEEAPVLACRLITQTVPEHPLPPIRLRLATTKGTNALLENEGAPTMFLTTRGFGDLMDIGDQKRPELFSMDIQKAEQLFEEVLEVDERMDTDGRILRQISLDNLSSKVHDFLQIEPDASFAICLMNSFINAEHENQLAKKLKDMGAKHISVSSHLSPLIKILPRAQTTIVNAYLQPILQEYLDTVGKSIQSGSMHVMTSAGGLVNADSFNPKDSLLSGPAGGVVGAKTIGNQNGFEKIISLDMGGTSTDVSRYDKGFDYIFEHKVGNARLSAPALSIETVAAGGGSICSFDGNKLTVGPESAGAFPGPACYGAGGPLTITDVNLLLGRLEEDNFGIPINIACSKEKFNELIEKVAREKENDPIVPEAILEGLLQIANERMADAIKKISMRKGYNPSNYALVGFGGAGAQHVCAIAKQLQINTILIPSNAGLLSAYGLGSAVIEQFAEKQLLIKLEKVRAKMDRIIENLKQEAIQKLKKKEGISGEIEIRKILVFMRLEGQDSTIPVPYCENLQEAFKGSYRKRFGHWVENRETEVETIRVVASSPATVINETRAASAKQDPKPLKIKQVHFQGRNHQTAVFSRDALSPGHLIYGPALILDPYSTTVVEPGWSAGANNDDTLVLNLSEKRKNSFDKHHSKAVALELFTNRFTSIAGEMGEMLKRTALSVNVKERMDYSCALLNPEGELIVNAPHIPVHLGALGLCVRSLADTIDMQAGDVLVTNHPAYGGSHLPDITVVTPIFTDDNNLLGYAASRAHHAEIGGTRPGSMPPDARSLAEEGTIIPPMHLVRAGTEQWQKIRSHLMEAPYPSRSIEENMADLQAAVAANHRGADALRDLAGAEGPEQIHFYMSEIKKEAALKCRQMLNNLPDMNSTSEEYLDDGTKLKAAIIKKGDCLTIDFSGTAAVHPGNLNATPAIVNSVIMYVLRLLIDKPLPLNEGLLDPVTIILPECMLNPDFPDHPKECPAVVGGNTETSQRLTDLLLKPFEVVACSQGTMNNVLFGNDHFGYYETIGGGTGAGKNFDGADAVHQHMTNTAGTDPETLEHRYPVRLDRYAIRNGSGGSGIHRGGDGIIREMTFLEPVSLSVLSQHRKELPYGLKKGEPGAAGKQWVIRKNGDHQALSSIDGGEIEKGDRFIIHTPGGGGYGSK